MIGASGKIEPDEAEMRLVERHLVGEPAGALARSRRAGGRAGDNSRVRLSSPST